MNKTDPRDDPQSWMNADSLLTRAEAEWYAAHWRERNARIEYRDPREFDTGVTRLPVRPGGEPVGCA